MKTSIVLLTYDKPGLTLSCLKALQNTDIGKTPIFLVDNGSGPDTRKIINKENLARLYPQLEIQILETHPNLGFGQGMNLGLKAAFTHFDLALTLSNDVELAPDFFSHLRLLQDIDSQAILCPQVFFLKDKSKESYTYGLLNLETWQLEHITHRDQAPKKILFPEYYPAAVMAWTKGAFEKTQGFSNLFYCYWEDVCLSLVASKKNVPLVSEPRLKAYHLGRGTTKGKAAYNKHFENGKKVLKDLYEKNH